MIFKNFFGLIKKSIEKNDQVSSTRLTSHIITLLIVLFCIYFLVMCSYIVITGVGSIPNELLIIFGSLLAHQLTLLGINKHHETKQKKNIK